MERIHTVNDQDSSNLNSLKAKLGELNVGSKSKIGELRSIEEKMTEM